MEYLIRYGEIALKGKNRHDFELRLKSNIISFIKNFYGYSSSVYFERGRLILSVDEPVNLGAVFGISSYSPGTILKKDIGFVVDFIKSKIKTMNFSSFKIVSSRIDKSFFMKSPEINAFIGSKIDARVDLKNPDLVVGVEVLFSGVFVYFSSYPGVRGLPVGSAEKVFVVSSEFEDVNAILLMKRGCVPVFDHNPSDLVKLFNNYGDILIDSIENHRFISTEILDFKKKDSLILHPLFFFSRDELISMRKHYEKIQKSVFAGNESYLF